MVGQGRQRRGRSGKGRRKSRGAKYQYNDRLLEEKRGGWRREGGERSLRLRGREGKEAGKKKG